LIDLVYRVFEVITFNNVTMEEPRALNPEACEWSRANLHRLPVDRRALKRRPVDLELTPLEIQP
jgi:hypothetical protein